MSAIVSRAKNVAIGAGSWNSFRTQCYVVNILGFRVFTYFWKFLLKRINKKRSRSLSTVTGHAIVPSKR